MRLVKRWQLRALAALSLTCVFLSPPIRAQVRNASIAGTITDNTGAALPGVTITVTSPALQVPQLVKVSEADGAYQFVDLPVGTYRLTYELSGFSRLTREDIRLTTGFAARLDVVLSIATLAETVVVRGQSPLVDVTNTRGGTTVTQEVLAAVPTNLTHQDVLLLAGGINSITAPMTGETGSRVTGSNNANRTYGQLVRMNNSIEGIKVMPGEAPDFVSTEEVDVKTFGNTADVDLPGAKIEIVFKSGGNQFHGRYVARGQHHSFQSKNIDDTQRAQGITQGDSIRRYSDLFGDLGGRIVPDKLWFYVSRRVIRNEKSALGYSFDPGPDGVYGNLDDTPGKPTSEGNNTAAKASYQITKNHKLIGFWVRNPLGEDQSTAAGGLSGRFTPYESTFDYHQINRHAKGEWQGLLSDRLLVNTMFGDAGYTAARKIRDDSLANPNRLNRETGFQTGAPFLSTFGRRRPWREQWSGSVNYYPRSFVGSHEIAAGFRLLWGRFETDFPNRENGERTGYRLVYDRVGGVPYQPVELHALSYPVKGLAKSNVHAVYGSDTWRPAKRLTVNLGLRWERNVTWVPPQFKEQGRFGTSGSFEQVDVGTWNTLAPRIGGAFDLSGDGKMVIKGTYGWYNHTEFDTGVPLTWQERYNKNSVTTYIYRWRDQDGNNDYTPGEVNLDPNGPDFLSVSGATNAIVNPDLKVPHTHEVTGSLERELWGNLLLRGLYVYKKVVDEADSSINALRPYSVWNQAITRRDPGPDGILGNGDDGGSITFYDYDPAYRGSRFVGDLLVNGDPKRSDSFQNVEVMLNKRPGAGRWFANTSLLVTKRHFWLRSIADNPNDEVFPLDETWDVTYRLAGGYQVPFGVHVATLYQAYRGDPGQRTYLFRAIDPDGGPSLPSSGSITLRMEPLGTRRGPSRHIVNLRASRDFALGGRRKLTLDVDAFNAFNSNVPWGGINYQSGPSFGYLTAIVTPRALQFGASFEF